VVPAPLWLLLAAFFIASCSNGIYKENRLGKTKPECLFIDDEREWVQKIAKKIVKNRICKDTQWRLVVISPKGSSCSSVLVKSTGSDIDSYVRIELRRGDMTLYKIQKDFKGDMAPEVLKELMSALKEDIF